MKKIITSALVVLATATGFSQEVKFGVKGGMNFNSLNFKNIENYTDKGKVGVNVGGLVEVKLNDKFAIQPEVLVSTQGGKLEIEEVLTTSIGYNYKYTATNNIRLTYLSIPVMFKYQVVNKLNVEFGPQFSFALSGKNKVEETGEYLGNTYQSSSSYTYTADLLKDGNVSIDGENIPTKGFLKSFDFGLNFGLSYDITDNFFVNARYNVGLTNIIDEKKAKEALELGTNAKTPSAKNSVFQIGVGVKF